MFFDREDAGMHLADVLREMPLRNPLVLGIPRGGIVVGAVLARELGADLDVVLARKLRAPYQPELAIGAIAESGEVYLNHLGEEAAREMPDYLQREQEYQLAEIRRRQQQFRRARPPAPVAGRSVIVADDGIATGATMLAALHVVRAEQPDELIVAAPVASPERLREIGKWCDRIVCIHAPDNFWAIGQFYEDFEQIEDAEVLELLRSFAPAHAGGPGA
ncbi:phosphoribosyltransferase [Planctomycetaceae bacterium SCGC AG-212-F19]|nr:phosphoribosyltransferase [Planctomycetaceae bacterium SCGC AG-212-F19]